MWHHKSTAKYSIDYTSSKSIILNDDYCYSVVEEFPCETKHQLHTRERWWIENNKCINKHLPTRGHKESQKAHEEKNKEKISKRKQQYYIDNKELIDANHLKWKNNNIEEGKLYSKNYREKHKEQINEYYINNKERIKAKNKVLIVCECGSKVKKYTISGHRKTEKHIKLMSCLPCPSPPQPSPL
jgi:hypothetical protein